MFKEEKMAFLMLTNVLFTLATGITRAMMQPDNSEFSNDTIQGAGNLTQAAIADIRAKIESTQTGGTKVEVVIPSTLAAKVEAVKQSVPPEVQKAILEQALVQQAKAEAAKTVEAVEAKGWCCSSPSSPKKTDKSLK